MVKSKDILKAPLAATIRQPTTDHSLGQGVDFTEKGKPENLEKTPQSTGGANYNNSTHTSSKFENQLTRGYTHVVTHPATTSSNHIYHVACNNVTEHEQNYFSNGWNATFFGEKKSTKNNLYTKCCYIYIFSRVKRIFKEKFKKI